MSRKTTSILYTSSGTGVVSFPFPISGSIVFAIATAQATGAAIVSFNGIAAAAGVQGSDASIIGAFVLSGASGTPFFECNVPVKAGQTVFIDVKTSGSFLFVVEV